MENKKLRYTFEIVENCEMCDAPVEKSRILGQRLNTSQGLNPKKKTGISVSVMKCRVCDLIYSQPMPIPYSIQDHYGTPPEDYWKAEYFNYQADYFAHQISVVKKLLPFREGMKSLDIGAGLGKCMISMERAGFEAFGFEPSLPFYQRAIEKLKISPEKLQNGMMEEIQYPDNSFDFITFGAVFEHLYHPRVNLEKALKWLKPGGIIHIEVPSSRHLIARLFNFYYRLRGTNYVTHISPMHTPFHLYEFGLKSFIEASNKLSYQIEKFEYYTGDIWFIPRIFHPPLQAIMKWTQTGMQLAVYLRKV